MKKLLTILFTISFLLLPTISIYAQEEKTGTQETQQVEDTTPDDNTEEESETLSDVLDTQTEQIQQEPVSFFTILGAILIPSIFIIIAYLILKFFKI
jgi:hypothetical protein